MKAIHLPNEAGTAIGGPHLSRYVLLEVHLNNPKLKTGNVYQEAQEWHYDINILHKPKINQINLGLSYT